MSEMPEFLTVEEAAALLRIGRTSAYALAREWRETGGTKGLPVVELGRQLRVPRAALERMHASSEGLAMTVRPHPLSEGLATATGKAAVDAGTCSGVPKTSLARRMRY